MAKVLVLGTQLTNDELVSQMVNYKALCSGEAAQPVEKVPIVGGYSVNINISNKYYTAELQLLVFDITEGLGGDSPRHWETVEEADVEGAIFSTYSTSEFLLTGPLAGVAENIAGDSCNLKLLASRTKSARGVREDVINWCVDHNIECIEFDPVDPISGYADREKDGLPRLIEALESNMWSTMTKKGAPKKPTLADASASAATTASASTSSGATSSAAASSSSSEITINDDSTSASTSASASTSTSSSTAAVAVESSDDPAIIDAQEEEYFKAFIESSKSTSGTTASSATATTTVKDDGLDNFSDMVAQARSLREDAQKGTLADDERRRRAADMAMRLCAMMNLDDSEDDSEED